MPDHRLVAASVNDISSIRSIALRTWPDTFGRILSAEQIDYMLDLMYSPAALTRQMESGHRFYLLLVADDDPMYPDGGEEYTGSTNQRFRAVGYISYEPDHEPGVAKVHKIYLLPGAQGKGYGRSMLEYVEKAARRSGQGSLRLDVNYRNGATTFYEHLGYRKLGRFDTDIGHGYLMEDWRMEKPLD